MKFICVIIGYFFGCFLTAEVVACCKAGKSAFKMGSGNPGTANIVGLFGVKWAAITLLGDAVKTVIPCMLCRYILFPSLGHIAILYAGFGTALGHGFPFWNKFRGGKGVAVTCIYIALSSFLWGVTASLAGLLVVVATGYLAVGALAIPILYLIPAFNVYGQESGLVVLAGVVLLFILHREPLRRIAYKTEKRIDLFASLKGNQFIQF